MRGKVQGEKWARNDHPASGDVEKEARVRDEGKRRGQETRARDEGKRRGQEARARGEGKRRGREERARGEGKRRGLGDEHPSSRSLICSL